MSQFLMNLQSLTAADCQQTVTNLLCSSIQWASGTDESCREQEEEEEEEERAGEAC